MGVLQTVRKLAAANATRAAIPGFVATMAIELIALRRRQTVELDTETNASNVAAPLGYEPRDTSTSLAMGIGSLVVNGFAASALEPLDRAVFARRLLQPRRGKLAFLAAVVAWDFTYYWNHRLSHERRVLWAAHVNHHSSEYYNLSTALRQSWTGVVARWVYLPLFALGFTGSQVARAGEINLLYQYWVHTETVDRLSPKVEAVFNTASHHRVHHGVNPQYLDRNYAGILIIWDRLFGTFEPEAERVTYGLTKNIESFNPVTVAFHEWVAIVRDVRQSTTWRERAGYVLGPPGWPADQAKRDI